ncbi:hypothetical protein [Halocynthiibacter namhaensis]|nr:hypothetical protein [Halocynthiibacter namhaensis]
MIKDIKSVVRNSGPTLLQDLIGGAALCVMLGTALVLPGMM